MPAGRPSVYTNPGDPFDNCVLVDNNKAHQFDDFQTEKDLCNFIEYQKEIFAKEVLGIDYIGHTREYTISEDTRLNSNRKGRVDFKFKSDKGDIYVECKKPTHLFSESVNAVAQLMAYSCLADRYNRIVHRLILITTHYNSAIGEIIEKFNLPIEVYILSKKNVMKLIVGGCHGRY